MCFNFSLLDTTYGKGKVVPMHVMNACVSGEAAPLTFDPHFYLETSGQLHDRAAALTPGEKTARYPLNMIFFGPERP